jgi:hypothetical protein
MTTPILALGRGKFKPVACLYPRGGKATPTFLTLASTREDLAGLLARTAPAVVVLEACTLEGGNRAGRGAARTGRLMPCGWRRGR